MSWDGIEFWFPPPNIVNDELYPWIKISVEYLSWPDCSSFHFLVVSCPSTYTCAPFFKYCWTTFTSPSLKTTTLCHSVFSFFSPVFLSFHDWLVATSQSWKDKNTGEKKEKTEWHRVVVFNEGLVNVVQQYLKKGAQVYVEGQLTTRKWKDEQSGQDKYSTEILIQGYNSSLTMLGGGNQNSIPSQDNKQSFDDSSMAQNELDDDIPF